ncbi:uncharacterized protein LOC143539474 [Bidens hawaiensis]|uniref:uncharacterized protein LOC143539474 n=1 Tax=Bidens hawaiensis TaxID=980011 RepID=UPI004048F249
MEIPHITIDSSNPLYLHPSDHPGMILVSKLFDRNGYGAWKRAMSIALSAKNKLGFINNTVPMPANQTHLALWQRCNDMVISWILNTLNHDVCDSVLYAEATQNLWNELNSRYGQVSGARVYQLQKNLYQISQESSDIATYFAKMKSNWDELNVVNSIPSSMCGAAHAFAKRKEDQRLIQFLVGLNPSYDMIRSNILMTQPFPSIDYAYGILIQDDKQKEIHATTIDFTASSASMHVNTRGPVSDGTGENKRNLVCTHCKRNGHSLSKCYKLIGFPKDFKFNKGKKFANLAKDQGKGDHN